MNINIPLFKGFLYSARAEEAKLRASAADAQVQQLRDMIARDVMTTVLQAQDNFNRITVAQQLLLQANSALALAQTRYQLGLSSIVELSDAQLLQTAGTDRAGQCALCMPGIIERDSLPDGVVGLRPATASVRTQASTEKEGAGDERRRGRGGDNS